MSETGRKHITVRYLTVPLQYDPEEEAHGTTLLALPDDADVRVLDAQQIGGRIFANLSIVTTQDMTPEELAEIEASIEKEASEGDNIEEVTPTEGEGIVLPSNVSPIDRDQRRKKPRKPPPVSG
jgi:hypothetical protein